jgi:hypothetical protein
VDKSEITSRLGMDPSMYSVALVPGSRPAEISRMLPIMCKAAAIHLSGFPDTQFALPLAGDHLSRMVREIIEAHQIQVSVHAGEAATVMAGCDSGLVTSGTATLQAALAEMPHAVVYILDRLTWLIAIRVLKPLVIGKDIHVAIANVLAISGERRGDSPIVTMLEAGFRIPCQECGRPLLVPEILQYRATPEYRAHWLFRFRSKPGLRQASTRGFQ